MVRLGRQTDAASALAEAERVYPQFERLLAAITSSRGFDATLAAMLKSDIGAASMQLAERPQATEEL